MRPNNKNRSGEFGGLFLYILVGVVLFGLLMYTYTKGGNVSSSISDKANSKVQAQAIIDYSDQMARAMEKLQSRGLSIDDISYKNNFMNNRSGTAMCCSTDPAGCSADSCRLFKPAGGNMGLVNPIGQVSTPSYVDTWMGIPGMSFIDTSNVSVQDLGTSAPEVTLMIWHVPGNVCNQIHNMLGIGPIPNETAPFLGTSTYGGSAGDSAIKGKSGFCFYWGWAGITRYSYMRVLAIR